MEFSAGYGDGLSECGVMKVVIVPTIFLQCRVGDGDHSNDGAARVRQRVLLHCKALEIFSLFVQNPIRSTVDKTINDDVINRLIILLKAVQPAEGDRPLDALGELLVQRGSAALSVFAAASEHHLTQVRSAISALLRVVDPQSVTAAVMDMRAAMVWNTVNAMMSSNGRVRSLFRDAGGFQMCLACLDVAPVAPSAAKQSVWVTITQAVLRTLAQAFAGPHAPNRIYFDTNIGYGKLAKAIIMSGILGHTACAEAVVDAMIGMFRGAAHALEEGIDAREMNAAALFLVIKSLPHLVPEKLAKITMARVIDIVQKGGVQCTDALAAVGAIGWILPSFESTPDSYRSLTRTFLEMVAAHRIEPSALRLLLDKIYRHVDPNRRAIRRRSSVAAPAATPLGISSLSSSDDAASASTSSELLKMLLHVIEADDQVQFINLPSSLGSTTPFSPSASSSSSSTESKNDRQVSSGIKARGVVTGLGSVSWPPASGGPFSGVSFSGE